MYLLLRCFVVLTAAVVLGNVSYAESTTLSEDWEAGIIDSAKWNFYGSPSPVIVSAGNNSNYSVNNNGDSNYWSWIGSKQTFRISQGTLTVEFSLKHTYPLVGSAHMRSAVGLGGPTTGYNFFDTEGGAIWVDCNVAPYNNALFMIADGTPTVTVVKEPVVDNNWHDYKIVFQTNGYVRLYQDGILKLQGPSNVELNYEYPFVFGGGAVYGPMLIDNIKITQGDVNQKPIADAGPDQSSHIGGFVTLNGIGSDDIDENYPISYKWSVVNAPAGSAAAITNDNQGLAGFSPDVQGDYTIQLIVTDSEGLASDSDEVKISTINSAPIANAGPDQVVLEIGTTVTLDGSQSEDPDGDPITYLWRVAGPTYSLELTSSSPLFIADVNGSYTITLVVNDGWDNSEPDTMIVNFDNLAPIANAGGNQSVVLGETVHLAGSGTDANKDQLQYGWAIISAPDGSVSSIQDSLAKATSFIPDVAGEYVLNLIVNDGLEPSDPDAITLTVISQQDAATVLLSGTIDLINQIDEDYFYKKNKGDQLTNVINQALARINEGDYQSALQKIDQILIRVDGCTLSGEIDTKPPANDWIVSCDAQTGVYKNLTDAYSYIYSITGASESALSSNNNWLGEFLCSFYGIADTIAFMTVGGAIPVAPLFCNDPNSATPLELFYDVEQSCTTGFAIKINGNIVLGDPEADACHGPF